MSIKPNQVTQSNRKDQIITMLKKQKSPVPTSKIGVILRMNYYEVEIFLKELQSEKKVKSTNAGRSVYWEII